MRLRELLRDNIPPELLSKVPSSFDVIGSREGAVAIVEIPPELQDYRVAIAKAIVKIHKNVKAVYEKKSGRTGVYRLREYKLLVGDRITEIIHKEHGIRLKLDFTKVYFSPREATERQRIARQVKPGEFIMVMFAGIGPYALAIAKKQPGVKRVVAIEINPIAYKYMVENIKLNKLEGKIIPVLGDVRVKATRWYGLCDRVIMPLPKGAYLFLDQAFKCLKPEGGVIHFYHWASEDNLFEEAYRLLERVSILHGYSIRILDARIVSPYAPRIYKVCMDVMVYPNGFT